MKLRYYLRGLGLGIVITTVFFAVSRPGHAMSDQEVMKRAKELGMVENKVLLELESRSVTEDDEAEEENTDRIPESETETEEQKTEE